MLLSPTHERGGMPWACLPGGSGNGEQIAANKSEGHPCGTCAEPFDGCLARK
ncbi:hypothetical protein [Arthrobacter sp. fls2-241-R2A-172]|uniref:hypothetical protein n=1 Tax=Arthrobacter sp. fls2-241-R2A-172 TaxID=3040325 RepID=UPI003307B24A